MSIRPDLYRETCKVKPEKVQAGDLMAIIYYVKVKDSPTACSTFGAGKEKMVVHDLLNNSGEIQIIGKTLIENSLSADFYDKEEKVTMTRLAEILCESPNRPLTVTFIKKDGSERKLRGRWIAQEHMLGRSFVEDLDIPKTDKEDGLREVDHRSIKKLVVNGVCYTLKNGKK
jgi:hypothetical protein